MVPVVIDCDPGQDDAVALMLALASPELEVLGVTTVAGNVAVERTSANARRIVEFAGRTDVPVFAGCAQPLRRPWVGAAHIHGESGLEGLDLPAPRQPADPRHAVDFLIETCRGRDGVTLCTLGPLTNVATALARAPDIARRLARIVAMGGARSGGNVTPVAEFNIHADPHAARIVFESGAPITMVPLDVTHQVRSTAERIARIAAIGTPVAAAVAELLTPAAGSGPGALHDPCVIAYLLAPELFSGSRVNVAVECESPLTLGMTVVDWRAVSGRPPNANVLHAVDADGVYALLKARLPNLG